MTLLVPLDGIACPPARPAFVSPVNDPATFASKVVRAIVKARRITVVCGAGISVQAGIPDFRSSDGLFQRIKRENPKENLSSGKDLFDASVFSAEHTTSLFCQMIARLSRLSLCADPTPFHNILRDLDERGKLLRVYTQNIDALEQKAGLTFGLPNYGARGKGKARIGKGTKPMVDSQPSTACNVATSSSEDMLEVTHSTDFESSGPVATGSNETPRCIPLHGTLQLMHCVSCNHPYPLSDHSMTLHEGTLPDCPDCTNLEATRSMVGKRLRGIGKLRPSVVLYNEEHSNGEGVGEAVRRDLLGRGGADLLIVVGTSLRVPGTKRIVREFSKAVKAKEKAKAERAHEIALSKLSFPTPTPSPSSSPSPSPRRTPVCDSDSSKTPSPPPLPDLPIEERPISSIYVNLDFPVPTREWDNVFDVWVQGDAQVFADMVRCEIEREEREKVEKLEREERNREEKKERDERRRREKEEKERMKQELEAERLARKPSKGTKKPGKKKSSIPTEGKVEKRKRGSLKVSRLPSTPRSIPRPIRLMSSGRTGESNQSEHAIASSSRTTYRPPSPSKSRLSILSSLASQSPHVYRRRSAPEDSTRPHKPYSTSSKYCASKGKAREDLTDSRLELLADAAATLSLSYPSRSKPTDDDYDTPFKRGEPSTPRRSFSSSMAYNQEIYATPRQIHQPLSPPDSRAQSHTRTRIEVKFSKAVQPSPSASYSTLSSVSALSPTPSPIIRVATPSIRSIPSDPSLEAGGYVHSPTQSSSSQRIVYESAPVNILDAQADGRHDRADKYESDVPSTSAKRKTDSVCASPKAPSRVKKVKLNITRHPDTTNKNDVTRGRASRDNERIHPVSPRSSTDRCSLNSSDAHSMSDSETDAPLHYSLRSPRQEVLCN